MADDTLGALRYILEMYHLLAVPVFDGTNADRSAHAEDVIAITGSEQRVVGIPITLRQFELRRTFAIRVNGLFLIEIDAVRHEFGLHRHAVVVNVGRGSAIDQDALIAALNSGHLGGAALDVMTPEPLPENHLLWTARNCLITPHISGGYNLPQTYVYVQEIALRNLKAYLAGEPLINEVNLNIGY